MADELTELTLEIYQKMQGEGKITQVSDPLIVTGGYGLAFKEMKDKIARVAKDHHANAYMIGVSRQVESGLVAPVVLYKIME